MKKRKLQTNANGRTAVTRQILVNGQQTQTSTLLQAMKAKMEASQTVHTSGNVVTAAITDSSPPNSVSPEQNKQFVVTPDYIQQSMFIYQPSVIVYNPNCAYPLQNDILNRF